MSIHNTLSRGWKARVAASQARREDRAAAWSDDRGAVREARAALADEARAKAEAAAAEIAAAMLRNRVSCPCCNGGADGLLVAHVELIIRAIAQMPEGSRPDARVLAELHGVAGGTYDGAGIELPHRGSLRLHRPRPVATDMVAETPADPVKPKAARKIAPLPFLPGAD